MVNEGSHVILLRPRYWSPELKDQRHLLCLSKLRVTYLIRARNQDVRDAGAIVAFARLGGATIVKDATELCPTRLRIPLR